MGLPGSTAQVVGAFTGAERHVRQSGVGFTVGEVAAGAAASCGAAGHLPVSAPTSTAASLQVRAKPVLALQSRVVYLEVSKVLWDVTLEGALVQRAPI